MDDNIRRSTRSKGGGKDANHPLLVPPYHYKKDANKTYVEEDAEMYHNELVVKAFYTQEMNAMDDNIRRSTRSKGGGKDANHPLLVPPYHYKKDANKTYVEEDAEMYHNPPLPSKFKGANKFTF